LKVRHIPIRTCVACRATDEKRDLLRVVRQPDRAVRYDPKGKLAGRGAYLCADANCIAQARKQKKLERALKVETLPEALFIELNARAMSGAGDPRDADPAAARTARVTPGGGQESEAKNV
jgi:predicted RNA-binding protein YlxR (DUF448 family)